MRRILLPFAIGLLCLALPVAASADDGVALRSGVPIRASGAISASADEGSIVLSQAPAEWRLDINQGTVSIISTVVRYSEVPGAEALEVDRKRTSTDYPLSAVPLRVVAPGPDFYAVAEGARATVLSNQPAAQPTEAWTDSNVQITSLLSPQAVAPPALAPPLVPVTLAEHPEAVEFPAGSYESRTTAASATLSLQRLVVFDGALDAGSQRFTSARTLVSGPGSLWVRDATGGGAWTGPGTHTEETTLVLVVDTAGAPLSLSAPSLTLYGESLLLDVDGFLQFPWADGKIRSGGRDTAVPGKQLLLGGIFTLRALDADPTGGPTVTWAGSGQLTFLHVGSIAAAISPAGAALLTTGVGVAAVGLAAGFYYWPLLKLALTGPFVGLYARLPRDRILDHKGRELVYETVKHEPGISTHRLADVAGFGWSTLAYHLRVLERNQVIISVRDGRYKRFFDRESGKYANGRKHVVAVLKNDTTLNIGRHILEMPGITQKDLGERAGLSPSSVHWHVARLAEAGLLDKRRDGHNVRYFPGEAWNQVPPEDVAIAPDLLAAFKGAPVASTSRPVHGLVQATPATTLEGSLPQHP